MSIKESTLTLMIKDLERSIAFYQSIGFTLSNRWGNQYAQLKAPGMVIGLHPSSLQQITGHSGNASIGFTSNNFEETKAQLEKLGITIQERVEEGGQFLHFSDPDGTALYFIKPNW